MRRQRAFRAWGLYWRPPDAVTLMIARYSERPTYQGSFHPWTGDTMEMTDL
jgi:hypothetical protein